MAKGDKKKAMNIADQERQQANVRAQQEMQRSQQEQARVRELQAPVEAGYRNLIQNPGFSSEQKNAITAQSGGALGSAFGALQDQAEMRAARTRNPQSQVELAGAMARDKGRAAADLTRANTMGFADAERSDVQRGYEGLTGLSGMGQQQGQFLGGQSLNERQLAIPYFQQYAGIANQPGFWDNFKNTLGSTLGKGIGTLITPKFPIPGMG